MPAELSFPGGSFFSLSNQFPSAVRKLHTGKRPRHRLLIVPARFRGIIHIRIRIAHFIFNLDGKHGSAFPVRFLQKFHEPSKGFFIPFQRFPAVYGQRRHRRPVGPLGQPVNIRLQLYVFRHVIGMPVFARSEPEQNQMQSRFPCFLYHVLHHTEIVAIHFRLNPVPVNRRFQTVSSVQLHRAYRLFNQGCPCGRIVRLKANWHKWLSLGIP